MSEYLSPDGVAMLLGVNRKSVYKAIQERRLPALQVGRALRVRRVDVEQSLRLEPVPVVAREARPRRSPPRGDFAKLSATLGRVGS